jgi:hypothetical protein
MGLGAFQLYNVPGGTIVVAFGCPFVDVAVKLVPLQMVSTKTGISALGSIVTVNVNIGPPQEPALPEVGVT